MLNMKNNENDEICKKKAKIKIKFQKMKGTLLDSIPWFKSHQPPLIYIFIFIFVYYVYLYQAEDTLIDLSL